jgi:hypothetical protein
MEITRPDEDQSERWYVSNGLLVVELITGKLQVGDGRFEPRLPANVNVAGDPDGTLGPTYASFTDHTADPALPLGSVVTQRLQRNGNVVEDPSKATFNVTITSFSSERGHSIASVFDDYFARTGPLWIDGQYVEGQVAGVYEVGYPVTEPYWSIVPVGGTLRDVLVQCFERRCLTYTPANDPEWQVEMGNVGQHYYAWRYEKAPQQRTGDVVIVHVEYDSPVADEQSGEYVVLQNTSDHPVNLRDWTLSDQGPEHEYTFPARGLMPGKQLRVYNCTGTNTGDTLYTGECQAWWNNGGDTATLRDHVGNVVSTYVYE